MKRGGAHGCHWTPHAIKNSVRVSQTAELKLDKTGFRAKNKSKGIVRNIQKSEFIYMGLCNLELQTKEERERCTSMLANVQCIKKTLGERTRERRKKGRSEEGKNC